MWFERKGEVRLSLLVTFIDLPVTENHDLSP